MISSLCSKTLAASHIFRAIKRNENAGPASCMNKVNLLIVLGFLVFHQNITMGKMTLVGWSYLLDDKERFSWMVYKFDRFVHHVSYNLGIDIAQHFFQLGT